MWAVACRATLFCEGELLVCGSKGLLRDTCSCERSPLRRPPDHLPSSPPLPAWLRGGAAVASGAFGLAFALAGYRLWRPLLMVAALLGASTLLLPPLQDFMGGPPAHLPAWSAVLASAAAGATVAAIVACGTLLGLLAAAAAAGGLAADALLHAIAAACGCGGSCPSGAGGLLRGHHALVAVGVAAATAVALAALAQYLAPPPPHAPSPHPLLRGRSDRGDRAGGGRRGGGGGDDGDCGDGGGGYGGGGSGGGGGGACACVPRWLYARRGGAAAVCESLVSAVLGAYGVARCTEYWLGLQERPTPTHNAQHTTHNTQHTTHNTQHTPTHPHTHVTYVWHICIWYRGT